MKILIFGGAGFLGTHLAKKLIQQGHKVTIFDKYYKNIKVNNFDDQKYYSSEFYFSD